MTSITSTWRDRWDAAWFKESPYATNEVKEFAEAFFEAEIATAKREGAEEITENTSDGYHTFKELYEFRLLYNAALFNEWALRPSFKVHKSKRHHEGDECFGGGWFVVMAELPTGQISNHYELKDWNLFHCQEVERANKWDKHTPQDVLTRIRSFISPKETK